MLECHASVWSDANVILKSSIWWLEWTLQRLCYKKQTTLKVVWHICKHSRSPWKFFCRWVLTLEEFCDIKFKPYSTGNIALLILPICQYFQHRSLYKFFSILFNSSFQTSHIFLKITSPLPLPFIVLFQKHIYPPPFISLSRVLNLHIFLSVPPYQTYSTPHQGSVWVQWPSTSPKSFPYMSHRIWQNHFNFHVSLFSFQSLDMLWQLNAAQKM